MTVLIITKSDDNDCIPSVIRAVKARGGRAYRFDTDLFPTDVTLALEYGHERRDLRLTGPQGTLDLAEVTAVWYRRTHFGAAIPDSMDKQLRSASLGESRATVLGMIGSLRAFHLDPVTIIRGAGHKQLQLQIAQELGLETPRTLISNDPEAVRRFTAECTDGVITKMLSSFAIYGEQGEEKVVFTTPLRPEDLEDLSGLRYCPMTFQERVAKQVELRVTVVGSQVFAASIDPTLTGRAAEDWRRDGVELIDHWKPYDLPVDIATRLVGLLDRFDLNYGAIDLIVTPEGRHVFLEINPAGEYFWLDRCPGLPISEAIADTLLGRAPRREHAHTQRM